MLGVPETEEKVDGNRLDVLLLQACDRPPGVILVQRCLHVAEIVEALGDLFGERLRRQQGRFDVVGIRQVLRRRLRPAAPFIDCPETAGDQQTRARAPVFQNGVGRHGGAVNQKLDPARVDSGLEQLVERIHHRRRRIIRP